MKQIDSFTGEYFFLSNFYPSPLYLPGLGLARTVEHAYQALKSTGKSVQEWVMAADTPGIAKKRGRQVELRPNWEEIKLVVMCDLVATKFFWDSKLARRLLDTGIADLIEGNTWGDTYWGRCNDVGDNHLGWILMTRRDELTQ